jgi:hypothetical protein
MCSFSVVTVQVEPCISDQVLLILLVSFFQHIVICEIHVSLLWVHDSN